MNKFIEKVRDYCDTHKLLKYGKKHIVALSGGADSVALLCFLKHMECDIEAVHCNFHLRGKESDRDEQFCADLCRRLDIPIHVTNFDTEEYAQFKKISIEMAARELRYEYFDSIKEKIDAEYIYVAHHKNDNAETILINIIRGTGLSGLVGIRPKNGNIVRPFLCVSRQEIETFLNEIVQDYITDSTNLVDDVVRNKLRLNIIPKLKEINPKVVDSISQMSEYIANSEDIVSKYVDQQLKRLVVSNKAGEIIYIYDLVSRVGFETILFYWLSPKGFNSVQIEEIKKSLAKEKYTDKSSKWISDSHQIVIMKEKIQVSLREDRVVDDEYMVDSANRFFYRGYEWKISKFSLSENFKISKQRNLVHLNKDKIIFPLKIRIVQNGDTFIPFGMKGRKLVNDLLREKGFSIIDKSRQLVLVNGNNDIIWVVGLRIHDKYRVDINTKDILQIEIAEV